jgi:hypothetical protein
MAVSPPREHPLWLKVVLNVCGPLGLGLALLGYLNALLGLTFTAIGVVYVAWELYPGAHKLVRRNPIMSLPLFLCGGLGLGFVVWLALLTIKSREPNPKFPPEGFSVVFKTELINMEHRLDENQSLWVLYTSGYGTTIAPVAFVSFLEITSLYDYPVRVSTYSLAIRTDVCGWLYLSPIDAKGVKLLWNQEHLNPMHVLNLRRNGFDYLWMYDVPAHGTQFGMLLFDTRTPCQIEPGTVIQFRLEMTDSLNRSYTYLSLQTTVLKTLDPGTSVGAVEKANFELIGQTVNATNAYRRFYSEPMPVAVSAEENGKGSAVVTPQGKIGFVGLSDGAYQLHRPIQEDGLKKP